MFLFQGGLTQDLSNLFGVIVAFITMLSAFVAVVGMFITIKNKVDELSKDIAHLETGLEESNKAMAKIDKRLTVIETVLKITNERD